MIQLIQVSTEVIENIEHIYWDAGEVFYNIDMKSIWTKAQQQYLDQRFDQVNTRIDNLEIKMDKKFDDLRDSLIIILARNGIK